MKRIYKHAWRYTDSGDQTYCDHYLGEKPDGWTVFVANLDVEYGDTMLELDTDSEETASYLADLIAGDTGLEIEEY